MVATPESLVAAIAYCKAGISVIPLTPRGKHPLKGFKWGEFQRRLPDSLELHEWWHPDLGGDPQRNIAVVCGPVSGNLVAIDADDTGPETLSLIERLPREAPLVQTSRGYHLWLRTKEPIPSQDVEHVEVKSGRRYVVAPPSAHNSGSLYRWVRPLEHIPMVEASELAAILPGLKLDITSTVARQGVHSSTDWGMQLGSWLPAVPADGAQTRVALADLSLWDKTREFVLAAMELLGIPPVPIGTSFHCVLPGHRERNPSANLYIACDGCVLYHDWHKRDGVEWYTLTDVFASKRYGRAVRVQGSEALIWRLRFLVETGFVKPVPVPMPPLPEGTRQSTYKVWWGFKLLLGCRWLYCPGEPTPFSRGFASVWCGVGPRQAYEALRDMVRMGCIEKAGDYRIEGCKHLALYLPGGMGS